MTNLSIGPKGWRAINNLRLSGLADEVVYEEYAVKVVFNNFFVEVAQLDQYSRLLNALFRVAGCSFFFEDVWYAIKGFDFPSKIEGRKFGEQEVNDVFVCKLVEFIIEEIDVLKSWPPVWFVGASEHLTKLAEKHFPDIAQEEQKRNKDVWDEIN